MLLSADTKVRLALDRAAVQASVRTKDQDGHLHVSATPITKATVNPYFGREVVNWRDLRLDPDRVYKLYRDPAELEKAAKSFNGKPLLLGHREVDSEAHDYDGTVGSVTGVYWDAPYIMASLDVWPSRAIAGIESEEVAELSAAYRYTAEMTPGTTPEGESFDGRMVGIDGNHVALVPRGRAGRDVVVRDAALWDFSKGITMKAKPTLAAAQTQGALAVYLKPKMAKDASIDLAPIVSSVTAKNFKSQIPAIVLGVMKATKGKLAQDADIEDVAEVIEALAEILPPEAEAEVKEAVESSEVTGDDSDTELRAMLKAKGLSDEEIDRICGMAATAQDEKDDDKKDDKAMDAATVEAHIRAATKGMVPKSAMDSAIAAAEARARAAAVAETTAHINGINEARRRVAPWVGELAMDFDSVEAVERQACDMLSIAHKGKHADALMDIIASKPRADERARQPAPRTAMDAAAAKSFEERFGTSRIGHAA